MENGYKKLIAWQLADNFAWSVYECSDKFPKEELYGLTSQFARKRSYLSEDCGRVLWKLMKSQ